MFYFTCDRSLTLSLTQLLNPCVVTYLTRSEPAQLPVGLCVLSVQGVMQVERRLGGYLLDKPKQMLFHFTGANLCVSIEDFSPGWRCKQNANYQVRQ